MKKLGFLSKKLEFLGKKLELVLISPNLFFVICYPNKVHFVNIGGLVFCLRGLENWTLILLRFGSMYV